MVRPAPLASTPTLPSSSMNLRPSALPRGSSSVSCLGRARLGERLAPRHAAVVDGELAVERDDAAVLGHDERIDLHQLGVGAGIDRRRAAPAASASASRPQAAATWAARRAAPSLSSPVRMSTGRRTQRIRARGRDLLDVHAALGREQHQRPLARGIVEHGRVELARDRRPAPRPAPSSTAMARRSSCRGWPRGGCRGLARAVGAA